MAPLDTGRGLVTAGLCDEKLGSPSFDPEDSVLSFRPLCDGDRESKNVDNDALASDYFYHMRNESSILNHLDRRMLSRPLSTTQLSQVQGNPPPGPDNAHSRFPCICLFNRRYASIYLQILCQYPGWHCHPQDRSITPQSDK
ncbi:unnamed protein product [Protopolystoma xenopodis]|uniref:Uncharacterized protein n=1 Tax=Protopolystoma xenopodis TaxID=117903 RepID=A0A3S5BMI3_9PLAT|nr:unnamed protein product [Protopolystoma xenopodis]